MKITIRPARTADELTAVADFDRKLFPGDTPVTVPGSLWWLAWARSTPVAFAGLRPCRSPENAGTGFMCRVGVLPKYRGRGLQRRLIHTRLAAARRLGITHVVTYTLPSNPASGNSLKRAGFRLYWPDYQWAGPRAIYWQRKSCTTAQ
jgi:GNAT superfamily N-acetyltransferase